MSLLLYCFDLCQGPADDNGGKSVIQVERILTPASQH